MEALETLASGDEGVHQVWPIEYFEGFYDFMPHGEGPHPNSCISSEERIALLAVSQIVDEASDATPPVMTADELIAAGWPQCIRPVAQAALSLMESRGRFSEDVEEWSD